MNGWMDDQFRASGLESSPLGYCHSISESCHFLGPTPSEDLIQFTGFSPAPFSPPKKAFAVLCISEYSEPSSASGTIHETFLIIFRYVKKCFDKKEQVYKLETGRIDVWFPFKFKPGSRRKQGVNYSFSAFCSRQALFRQGTLTLGRIICFTQFTDSNVNHLQKYPHRNTQNNVNQIYEHPVVQ